MKITTTSLLLLLAATPVSADVILNSVLRQISVSIPGLQPVDTVSDSFGGPGAWSDSVTITNPANGIGLTSTQDTLVDVTGSGTGLNIGIIENSVLATRTRNPSSYEDIDASSLLVINFTVSNSGINPFTFAFSDVISIDDQSAQAGATYQYNLTDLTGSPIVLLTESFGTSNSQKTSSPIGESFSEMLSLGNGTYEFRLEHTVTGKMANSNQQPVLVASVGPTPVPEPGTALLGALALLPLARRRR